MDRWDLEMTPEDVAGIEVKQLPTIIQLEDVMPAIEWEARWLDSMGPAERGWVLEMMRRVDEGLDDLVLRGTGS